jgi:hypothetical protein
MKSLFTSLDQLNINTVNEYRQFIKSIHLFLEYVIYEVLCKNGLPEYTYNVYLNDEYMDIHQSITTSIINNEISYQNLQILYSVSSDIHKFITSLLDVYHGTRIRNIKIDLYITTTLINNNLVISCRELQS